MRLCIVSDTHRRRHELLASVKTVQPIDAILHAGDETSDASWLSERVDWPVLGVAGNWDKASERYPVERIIDRYGPRILLTHGHLLRVKDNLAGLSEKAAAHQADIVIYGHTHIAAVTAESGKLFLNPGSLAEPRGRRERTFALLSISKLPNGGYTVDVSLVAPSGAHIDDRVVVVGAAQSR
ncbi:metallophosphoesterase [Alicyclobacillus tolerans]|uniref:metallophosphoesterase family protein n=1 Tax=Alicyclobacillus tolerans TaxID=90970 RepID=UPI001F1BDD26|nr:metallophosphoesterase [Alicyclobacillus tolerans]MCF8563518.1 metallophosphoesterase [Alicyclobacillus tolerans]